MLLKSAKEKVKITTGIHNNNYKLKGLIWPFIKRTRGKGTKLVRETEK